MTAARKEILHSLGFSEKEEGYVKAGDLVVAIREFLQGAFLLMPAMIPMQERAAMERLFLIVVLGDKLGIPLIRPYYALRLLPYVAPRITPWMRSLLKERDLTDIAFD